MRDAFLESLEGVDGPIGGGLVPAVGEFSQENVDAGEFAERVGGGFLVGYR